MKYGVPVEWNESLAQTEILAHSSESYVSLPKRGTPQLSLIHRPLMHAFIFIDTFFGSRLYRAIGDNLQPAILGVITLIIVVYIAISFSRLKLFTPYLSMAVMGTIGLQLYIFSQLAYSSININAGFQYVSVASFVVFFVLSLDNQREYMVRTYIVYATCYSFIYTMISMMMIVGVSPLSGVSGLILTDSERGGRLFIYGTAAAFAYFYWLQKAKHNPDRKNVFMALMTFAAIVLSQSRVFGLVIVVISVLYIVLKQPRKISYVCLAAFWSVLIINLYGLIDPSWNPYSFFEGDSSGTFRMLEYNVARTLISDNVWFGVGIAANAKDAWFFIGQDFFSANDLGSIGVWIDWGLLGFIFFIICTHVICKPLFSVRTDYSVALFLTGCMLVATATISPSIMYPGGSVTFAMILGFHLDRRNLKFRAPLPHRRVASSS